MGMLDTWRDALVRWIAPERSTLGLSFTDWLQYFSFNGNGYTFLPTQTLGEKQEAPAYTYEGFIQGLYKSNGIVFACMAARMLPFSEARFQWRRMRNGRPGELFGDEALEVLEHPGENETTGDLLSRMIQHADLAGNAFIVRLGDRLNFMRPDWTVIVVGSKRNPEHPNWALDAKRIGYAYYEGGINSGGEPEILFPEEVGHFAPIPDPAFRFRGMSWLTPVVREVMGDNAATTHKLKFFENGATPNMVVSLDKSIGPDAYDKFLEKMKREHEGILNAYRTLYLGGGSTATVVGANMRQIDFKITQGAGETRIAAAARIPAIIVGLSEGLEAATYANYGQARRAFADGTLRPYWRNAAGSLQHLVTNPGRAQLWYDDRDIPFLQEDVKDAAEIQAQQAQAIRTLIEAGYKPKSVVAAITAGRLEILEHSGLVSVQLQKPGSQADDNDEEDDDDEPEALPEGEKPKALPEPKREAEPADPGELDTTKPVKPAITSPRHTAIAERLARGLTQKQIAAELDVSERTVQRVAAAMRGGLAGTVV